MRRDCHGAARAAGIMIGVGLDRVLADPRRWHPVAGLGRFAAAAEARLYDDSRAAGVAYTAVCVGTATSLSALALLVVRARDRSAMPLAEVAITAAVVWATSGGTTLARVVTAVADALDAGDVSAARALVPSLCGRDPDSLDRDGIVRAALESLAENTSDAAVGPLVWCAAWGVPGAVAYRTANTLDAMVGYTSPRYRRFGWAAARLDDVANVIPARLTAAAVVVVSGHPGRTARTWRRDAGAHPSPNAGVVESAFAGALRVGLGGRTVYGFGVQDRPRLGDGPPPGVDDLRAAVRLSRRVQLVLAGVAVAAAIRC